MYGLELNWILVGRIEMDGWMDGCIGFKVDALKINCIWIERLDLYKGGQIGTGLVRIYWH